MASLVAGLVGTIVMTIVMMLAGDGGPPPTASLVSTFAGGEPADHAMPGMVLHVLYGIVAGAVFAVGVPLIGIQLTDLVVATGLGIGYGLVLMVVGMGFWMRLVMGMQGDTDTILLFAVVHVVYGAVLGAFVGSGIV